MAGRAARSQKQEGRMSLAEHLIELRKRLYISAAAIVVGTVIGWFLSDFLLNSLRAPIFEIATDQARVATLNYDAITSAFDLKLQIAFTVGVVISSPVWLFQIWAFFIPGLTQRERAYSLGFFLSAVPLFILGCAAGWFIFPRIVQLMTSFAPSDDSTIITAKTYFDFVLKLVLIVGVAFVLPVFLVLLNFAGVLSAASIIKSWRMAILVIVLFTAIATPAADVLSMILLAIPMVLLYFAAALIAWIHDRRQAKRLRGEGLDLASTLPPSEPLKGTV
jgi:sec-independent protein translocase protein TatC